MHCLCHSYYNPDSNSTAQQNESICELLEQIRQRTLPQLQLTLSENMSPTASLLLTFSQHAYRATLSFLGMVCIIYARVSVDRFSSLLLLFEQHWRAMTESICDRLRGQASEGFVTQSSDAALNPPMIRVAQKSMPKRREGKGACCLIDYLIEFSYRLEINRYSYIRSRLPPS
jgi:hypothetical protein